jgi:PAS domain S-box-containing protein
MFEHVCRRSVPADGRRVPGPVRGADGGSRRESGDRRPRVPMSDRSRDRDRYGLLFELSEDAVAEIEIVDGIPVVRAVNPAFVDVFGYDRESIIGESLNDYIVPEHRREESAVFDRRTADGEVNWSTVSRRTADGLREFLYRGVPFERDGASHGLAIYTDVTDQRRRDRHHQVLHRLLRHNLRNDLTQVLAAVRTILAETDDEVVGEQARRIRALATDLEEASQAAGRVEDLLGSDHVEFEPVDLAGILRGLVERYRQEHPDATIRTALPESRPVTADQRLELGLDALIENAVEHGSPQDQDQDQDQGEDGGPVEIRITIVAEGNEAVARITDNGDGIPDCERAAIFDDRPPTKLSHGSGLGLWLAKWVVEGYGGRLTYARRGGETTVAARVPLAPGG